MTKNTFYYLALFFPLFITNQILSQDFDEAFLESLPDSIAADLLESVKQKEFDDEIKYTRPSSKLTKPEIVASERFGINIFSTMQSTFMPLNEPNVDNDYILDFGDTLEIQIVGEKSSLIKSNINRDGSINIADIGKVFVSGLSLESASSLIKGKIKSAFIGIEVFVSLISVRDIQVLIAGDVFNPGLYTLNGNSNIFHALVVSGGPTENGSFRRIRLVRDNKTISSIDLYDTFIEGKTGFGPRLKSGDIVFIEPVGNLVNITGAVKRGGTFELDIDDSLYQIINFANGTTINADLSQIYLNRIQGGNVISEKISNLSDLENIISQDKDQLLIRPFPFRSVSIGGAIQNPGTYLLNEGDGILEIILRAGGYSSNAYPFGGILENESARVINEFALDTLYKNFLNDLSSLASSMQQTDLGGSGLDGLMMIMAELRDSEPSGRVIAEFNLDVLESNPESDILLQDGDEIFIPELVDQVYVFGEVVTGGTVKYLEGAKLNYYIDKKGGFSNFANKRGIYVMSPNGDFFQTDKNIFANQTDISLTPGSIIFVPRKVRDGFVFTQTAQAYAAILGNIGLSLASVSVLKD